MLETSRVKGCLEGWREPVLHASSVLFWDKDWYPGVIAGALTAKFLFVWWWDPTLLSLLATTGFFLTLADYLGPKILAQVRQAESKQSYLTMGLQAWGWVGFTVYKALEKFVHCLQRHV